MPASHVWLPEGICLDASELAFGINDLDFTWFYLLRINPQVAPRTVYWSVVPLLDQPVTLSSSGNLQRIIKGITFWGVAPKFINHWIGSFLKKSLLYNQSIGIFHDFPTSLSDVLLANGFSKGWMSKCLSNLSHLATVLFVLQLFFELFCRKASLALKEKDHLRPDWQNHFRSTVLYNDSTI